MRGSTPLELIMSTPKSYTITSCEVCDGTELVPVLDLGAQPMCDDLVPVGNDAMPRTYPIELLACPTCLTVHQKYQVEKKALFPATYHYRAAMTKDVLDGMAELVVLAEGMRGDLKDKVVLDVGVGVGVGKCGAKTDRSDHGQAINRRKPCSRST
jgi:hypothetical protein